MTPYAPAAPDVEPHAFPGLPLGARLPAAVRVVVVAHDGATADGAFRRSALGRMLDVLERDRRCGAPVRITRVDRNTMAEADGRVAAIDDALLADVDQIWLFAIADLQPTEVAALSRFSARGGRVISAG